MKYLILFLIISSTVIADPFERASKRAQIGLQKPQSLTPDLSNNESVGKARIQKNNIVRENFIQESCKNDEEYVSGRCLKICSLGYIRKGSKCVQGCEDGLVFFNGQCLSACPANQMRNENGKCDCPDNFKWNGKACIDSQGESFDENDICPENEIYSGKKCLKKSFNCELGYDFIDGGNALACICPKGAQFQQKTKNCLCDSDGKQPKNGKCQINYCQLNKIHNSQKNNCECPEKSIKLVSTKDKKRFQCRALCDIGKPYTEEKNSCVCPDKTKKMPVKSKSFQCVPKED